MSISLDSNNLLISDFDTVRGFRSVTSFRNIIIEKETTYIELNTSYMNYSESTTKHFILALEYFNLDSEKLKFIMLQFNHVTRYLNKIKYITEDRHSYKCRIWSYLNRKNITFSQHGQHEDHIWLKFML